MTDDARSALAELCEEVWTAHRDPRSGTYNQCEGDAPCQWCIETKAALDALAQQAAGAGEWERILTTELRTLGCQCPKPLIGYSPGYGPRCRLCQVDAEDKWREQAERIAGFKEFIQDVKSGSFPAREHIVEAPDGLIRAFVEKAGRADR